MVSLEFEISRLHFGLFLGLSAWVSGFQEDGDDGMSNIVLRQQCGRCRIMYNLIVFHIINHVLQNEFRFQRFIHSCVTFKMKKMMNNDNRITESNTHIKKPMHRFI